MMIEEPEPAAEPEPVEPVEPDPDGGNGSDGPDPNEGPYRDVTPEEIPREGNGSSDA
jgi:hypothetical protein